MEFRLVFRGSLPSHGRANRVDIQRIRQELHPQLRTFWQQHPLLKAKWEPVGEELPLVEQVANDFARGGFRFVPLVDTSGACALDILLLRRDEPYKLFTPSGDLDGRIKTLLDGLRMPQQLQEVDGLTPSSDENPLFVLLQDDSLIYELNVTTDRLFIPPEPQEQVRDVVAVIRVRIRTFSGNPMNIYDYGP
jgi:hypothetical protein